MTRREEIIEVLINLGGVGTLSEIVDGVKAITKKGIPPKLDASLRCEIEKHSSDSAAYIGADDIFYSVCGIGNGVWGLRLLQYRNNQKEQMKANRE